MTNLVLESNYFPCIAYFSYIYHHREQEIWIEMHENFQKQTYRNRCEILTANKVDILTVPVQKANSKHTISQTKIDYSQNWQKRHWRAIQSGYGKAPFFEYYAPEFEKIITYKFQYLTELNSEILTLCLKILKLEPIIRQTGSFEKVYNENFLDLRNKIITNKDFKNIPYKPYNQIFSKNFIPNLSILDLIFCQGNQVVKFLA
jgi:hypothetical protein